MNQHYCDIEELMKELEERTTPFKHALLELLMNPTHAWTAKQLWIRLRSKPSGNLASVHRNLINFKKSELIQVALKDGMETVYERQTDKHHDHLKCTDCGTYRCIPCATPAPKPKERMKILSHSTLYQGLCPNRL